MNRSDVFQIFFNGFSYTWRQQFWQGLLFILFGMAVLAFPQLLVAMVASFFILIGLGLTAAAWTLRRLQRSYDGWRSEFYETF